MITGYGITGCDTGAAVDIDGLTGATTSVELVLDLPIEQVWRMITDVGRIGEWSPETVSASWHGADGGASTDGGPVTDGESVTDGGPATDGESVTDGGPVIDSGPRVGARFGARNDYRNGFTAAVECVVTEAVRPSVFEWVVLDDDRDVTRPGSIWRYELKPHDQHHRTVVRHRFTHGPGLTGLRDFVQRHPDRTQAAIDSRLAQLRANMTATLHAMENHGKVRR